MEHFPEHAWADFMRGIGTSTGAGHIADHLLAGCPECGEVRDFWSRIRNFASNESAFVPPDNLVRRVNLEFAGRREFESEHWILGQLVFDSFAQPSPVGIRSMAAASRQIVYEAEGLTVDLRLGWEPRSRRVCVVGQMLDKLAPQPLMPGGSVVLWTEEGRLVAAVDANEFGEFELEFEPRNDLRLSARAGGRTIRIPLEDLT